MGVSVAKTVSAMITQFLIEYDRIVAQISKSYTDDEIVSFLNRAQSQLIDELYKEKRYDLLGALFVNDSLTTAISTSWDCDNGSYIDLSSHASLSATVKYVLNATLTLTRTNFPVSTATETEVAEWISPLDVDKFTKDSGNSKILFRVPKMYQKGNKLLFIYDAYSTLTGIMLEYVKEPLVLTSGTPSSGQSTNTSELKADLHDDIVTRAVYLAKEATDRLNIKQ